MYTLSYYSSFMLTCLLLLCSHHDHGLYILWNCEPQTNRFLLLVALAMVSLHINRKVTKTLALRHMVQLLESHGPEDGGGDHEPVGNGNEDMNAFEKRCGDHSGRCGWFLMRKRW